MNMRIDQPGHDDRLRFRFNQLRDRINIFKDGNAGDITAGDMQRRRAD
jgi:hypothetical protein